MTNLAPIMIENGSIIRLQHKVTERRLHSHDFRPPVTEADWQNEVSAYGFPGFEGDANDFFRVEIGRIIGDFLAISTELVCLFRIRNKMSWAAHTLRQ